MSIPKSFIKKAFTCYLIAFIIGCNSLELVEEQYLDDSPKKSCILMGEIKKWFFSRLVVESLVDFQRKVA